MRSLFFALSILAPSVLAKQQVVLDGKYVNVKVSPPNNISPSSDTIEFVRTKDTPRKVRLNVIYSFGTFRPLLMTRAVGVSGAVEVIEGEKMKFRLDDGPLFLGAEKIYLRFVNAPTLEDGQTESFEVKIFQKKISKLKLYTEVTNTAPGYNGHHINVIGPSRRHLKFFYNQRRAMTSDHKNAGSSAVISE